MNIPEKVRSMDEKGQLHYFLNKFLEVQNNPTVFNEVVEKISGIMAGTPIDKIFETYDLQGAFLNDKMEPCEKDPVAIRIDLEDGKHIVFDMTYIGRKEFLHPEPIKPEPIRSMLSAEDRKEILEATGIKIEG